MRALWTERLRAVAGVRLAAQLEEQALTGAAMKDSGSQIGVFMYSESADNPEVQSMHIARICVPHENTLYILNSSTRCDAADLETSRRNLQRLQTSQAMLGPSPAAPTWRTLRPNQVRTQMRVCSAAPVKNFQFCMHACCALACFDWGNTVLFSALFRRSFVTSRRRRSSVWQESRRTSSKLPSRNALSSAARYIYQRALRESGLEEACMTHIYLHV